jgi:hypothetical protein
MDTETVQPAAVPTLEQPFRADFATRFKAGSARSAGVKSGEARRLKRLQEQATPAFEPVQKPAPPLDTFISDRLESTRAEIRRVAGLLAKCEDPAEVDKYASALSRLHDIERTLAGRPLPGSLRPTAPGRKVSDLLGDQIPGVG